MKIEDQIQEMEQRLAREEAEYEKRRKLEIALQQGQAALAQGVYASAKTFFESALEVDDKDAQARAGLIETLLEAGQNSEKRGKLTEARDFYRALLDYDNKNTNARARMNAIKRSFWQRWFIAIVTGAVLLLIIAAQVNHFINWPLSVCNSTGAVLCTPSPTATSTATATPTATPTNTPTATPTFTPTPTNTPTSTPTPTPSPYMAEALYETAIVYKAASGSDSVGYTAKGQSLYVCAQAGTRYLVAQNLCHVVNPWGWIESNRLRLLFNVLPESLVTPWPTATATRVRPPAAPVTPTPTPPSP